MPKDELSNTVKNYVNNLTLNNKLDPIKACNYRPSKSQHMSRSPKRKITQENIGCNPF